MAVINWIVVLFFLKKANINVFMLGVVYKGVALALLFTMLNKRWNSNRQERIVLVDRFIGLSGKGVIDCIVVYREFVGEQWLEFLNRNNIGYYIRIRNNFKVLLLYHSINQKMHNKNTNVVGR